mmetsp:Transcript_101788/g.283425  ORF Transcript_101788/g.283425 Transcript_101788/m.283425 type:complete len:202 (+) Transcript_101788:50-655(+)
MLLVALAGTKKGVQGGAKWNDSSPKHAVSAAGPPGAQQIWPLGWRNEGADFSPLDGCHRQGDGSPRTPACQVAIGANCWSPRERIAGHRLPQAPKQSVRCAPICPSETSRAERIERHEERLERANPSAILPTPLTCTWSSAAAHPPSGSSATKGCTRACSALRRSCSLGSRSFRRSSPHSLGLPGGIATCGLLAAPPPLER